MDGDSITARGTWDIGTAYDTNDLVTYNDAAYVAIEPSTGLFPAVSPGEWMYLVADALVTSVAGRDGDVVLTKSDVGLSNVDNTSDAGKPVSTAQQTALNLKANLASPTFTGTVTGISKSMVGLGSVDNTADTAKPVSTAQQTALNLKANLASPTFTGTVSGISKSMVGLGNVDNTTDAGKPVSTAQQTALDLKSNIGPHGIVRRTTTALTSASGSYNNISANAAWGSSDLGVGMTYSNGFVIPAGWGGRYLVHWQLLATGANGIGGIVVNAGGSVNGNQLHAGSTLQNGGAIFGAGSAPVRLAAGDVLTFWLYANGSTVTVNALANQAPHWGAYWIGA